MSFPTQPDLTKIAFRSWIIDEYWPNLVQDIQANKFITAAKKHLLRDDYAEIGAFLSNRRRVFAALAPLEQEIRQKLKDNFPSTVAAAAPLTTRVADGGESVYFKSGKLLSNALLQTERLNGFNHEKIEKADYVFDDFKGTLHAGGGTADKQGVIRPAGQNGDKVALGKGVPTIVGELDPLAFQSVLIKHGYQFKDVAAGPYHGEYTHRLQWHAIMRAMSSGGVALHNTPLDIFKSLGYLTAKATHNVPAGRHLYLWEALFDTAETEERAASLGTAAVSSKGSVFTCPENLNKSLMNLNGVSFNNLADLWCLRVLVKTRWKKRFDENDGVVVDAVTQKPKVVGMPKLRQNLAKTSVVVSTSKREGAPTSAGTLNRTIEDAGYALVWYLRDATGKKL